VKTIGDAVMLRVAEPAEAILLGLRITAASAEHGAATVRAWPRSDRSVEPIAEL